MRWLRIADRELNHQGLNEVITLGGLNSPGNISALLYDSTEIAPSGHELEHRAVTVRAACGRGSVERDAAFREHTRETCLRIGTVGRGVERVQHGFHALWRQLVHCPRAVGAAAGGYAVKIAVAVHDEFANR